MVQVSGSPFSLIHLSGRNPLMLEVQSDSQSKMIISTSKGTFLDVDPFQKNGMLMFRTAFSRNGAEDLLESFVTYCRDSNRFRVNHPPKNGKEWFCFDVFGCFLYAPTSQIGTIWSVGEYVALAASSNLCIIPHELVGRASQEPDP